jgi:hypothetical protein
MKLSQLLLGIALAASVALPAHAQVVYNNGGPDGATGLDFQGIFTVADNFSFVSGTSFDAVRFWNVNFGGATTAGYTWSLYGDELGEPGLLLSTGFAVAVQTAQGSGCCGSTRYQNDMNIGIQSLGAGTYWLALRTQS